MPKDRIEAETVADAYLALLARRGIDFLFANAGTDFASIIEAFAKAKAMGRKVPEPVLVPHENVAVAMAHGYYMLTGRMQAVMVHVGPGTANALNGIMNAARQRVPILMTAGRTPINESGVEGARNNFIHWAQESFDQAGMIREYVKWDYELRNANQLETVVDRALALARTEPRGPVYLSLPREVLATRIDGAAVAHDSRLQPAASGQPDPAAIARAAEILSTARAPLIVTSEIGETARGVAALSALARHHAIPVVQHRPRFMCLPDDHEMQLGYDPGLVADADAVLVIDCDVPWIPADKGPPEFAKVIQLGVDPLFGRYPIRGFPSDVAITGPGAVAVELLDKALRDREENSPATLALTVDERRARVGAQRAAMRARWAEMRDKAALDTEIQQAWASACIARACDADTIVVNEYTLALDQTAFTRPLSYFSHSPSGGLGWGLGAALGAKLAAPDKTVIAVLGDGAYMFGNPTPAHYVAQANRLPFLTVILNNAMWGAVHRSTTTLYPGGYAARDNAPPLTFMEPSPSFEKIVEASGGYGELVERPDQMEAALARALHAVKVEGRQALLNVRIKRSTLRTS
jgi:acetolactate synthase-1/2/3 large subunit